MSEHQKELILRGRARTRVLQQWYAQHPSPWTPAELERWTAAAQEFERSLDKDKASWFQCGTCHDRKFILVEGLATPCRDCNDFNQADGLKRYANLPDRRWHDKFETFDLDKAPLMREAHQAAFEFANAMSVPWLVIIGEKGCGKTHLLYAVGNKMAETGWKVRFWSVPDLFDCMRAVLDAKDADKTVQVHGVIEEMVYTPAVLLLDDLGTEKQTGWVDEELFQVIDRRYREGKGLMVTTNVSVDALPDRIRDRFLDKEICRVVVTKSTSYRPEKRPPQRGGRKR